MAEHIDLGDELGAWEDPVDSPPAAPPPLDRGQSRGRGRWMPLADLQAQGFNTTPPPGFAAGGRIMGQWRLTDEDLHAIVRSCRVEPAKEPTFADTVVRRGRKAG